MKPNIPRKQTDPEIPFTASLAKELSQRLARIECSLRIVKVWLTSQASRGDEKAWRELILKWEELEERTIAASDAEWQYLEIAVRNLSQRVSPDPDA